MNARSSTTWVIALLLLLGAASIALRIKYKPEPLTHPGESVWKLTYFASFHARKAGAELQMAYPETTRHSTVLESPTTPPELDVVPYRPIRAASRKDLTLRTKKAGQVDCRVEFKLHLSRRADWRPDSVDKPLTARDQSKYLDKGRGIEVGHPSVAETVNRLRDGNPKPQELVERLFEHCLRSIIPGGDAASNDGTEALVRGTGSTLGRARAFTALCRACKVPARLVTGFEIKLGNTFRPHTWVEVFIDGRWQSYDLENGFARELDYNFVPVRRDGVELIRAVNPLDTVDVAATDLVTRYTIEKLPAPPVATDPGTEGLLQIFDLRRLPVKLHEPIKVILILPLGALFTAFVRTIVGIRTFGTFTPTLLALAFVFNDLKSGICVFVVVLITGFISRTLLDRLKLLLVPRLGIVLTLVVMLMVLGVAVINHFHWNPHKGETVLLPMVILTNLVERFFVTSEEDNLSEAGRLMGTTMAMAFVIYLLLNFKNLGTLMFDFPELHFFTVIVLILMGRYTGYRVSELIRFRDLVQRDPPPQE